VRSSRGLTYESGCTFLFRENWETGLFVFTTRIVVSV